MLVSTSILTAIDDICCLQKAFHEHMVANSDAFLVNLVFQITAGTNAVKNQPESNVPAQVEIGAVANKSERSMKAGFSMLKKTLHRTFTAIAEGKDESAVAQGAASKHSKSATDILPPSPVDPQEDSKSAPTDDSPRSTLSQPKSSSLEGVHIRADPEDVEHLTSLFRFIQVST